MRIKPLAMASACMLAMSAPAAMAGLDFHENTTTAPSALSLNSPLPSYEVLAQHGLASLDIIKHDIDRSGHSFVAQNEHVTKTDVPTTAAVAQMGPTTDDFSYSLVALLLALIGGGFMWLSLMRQRREH